MNNRLNILIKSISKGVIGSLTLIMAKKQILDSDLYVIFYHMVQELRQLAAVQ